MMNFAHLITVRLAPSGGALKSIFLQRPHLIAVTFIYLPYTGGVLWLLMPLLVWVILHDLFTSVRMIKTLRLAK